ncbi:MAG TPA: membrane protein insertion efficiency factor YidD [Verrucomicrobiae bacterium]|nr:membrane protein insertion efficiency factor YidD [Verrucomicrobiae bacterium]
MIRLGLTALIRFYQNFISPLKGSTCRFYPSCSEYSLQAIEVHGVLRGCLLGFCRIIRCQPFHPGGYDPVKRP